MTDSASPPLPASAPRTGDPEADATLGRLARTPVEDADAVLRHGEDVQRALRARLEDLGG